jgi:hypothetical protein
MAFWRLSNAAGSGIQTGLPNSMSALLSNKEFQVSHRLGRLRVRLFALSNVLAAPVEAAFTRFTGNERVADRSCRSPSIAQQRESVFGGFETD